MGCWNNVSTGCYSDIVRNVAGILLTRFLKSASSPGVRESDFPMTGMMLILGLRRFISSMSISLRLSVQGVNNKVST